MADSTNIAQMAEAEKAPNGIVVAPSAADSAAVRTAPAPRVNPAAVSSADSPTSFDDYRAEKALTPDETAKISDQYTQRLKDTTDAISATFGDKLNRQKDTNDAELMRTRVLNSKTGNIDSGTGSAAISTTTKKGNDALTAIDNEKQAKIEQAIGAIDDLKVKQIEAESTKKSSDLTAYNNLRATNAKTADATLQTLAKSGASLDALKADKKDPNDPNEPSSFDALAKSLDLSPLELTTKFNAYKDAAHQVKYTYKIAGDKIIAYGVDPVTGKLSEQDQTVPGLSSGNWEIKEMKDGSIYKFNKDTSELVPLHTPSPTDSSITDSSGKPIAPGKTIKDGGLTTSEGEIARGTDLLLHGATIDGTTYNGTGKDSYVDPDLYQALYNIWRGKGGTPAGFVKYYPPKDYVNPAANGQLPSFLHNTSKASSSSSSSGGA